MRLADLPDGVLIDYLMKMKSFSRLGAKQCINNFRSTMEFADLDATLDWKRQQRWELAIKKSSTERTGNAY